MFCALVAAVAAPAGFAQTPTGALAPAAAAVAAPTQSSVPPIDAHVRWKWLLVENLSPAALAENVAIGGVDTLFNTPKEYQPHWKGFGLRIGLITENYALKSSMEVGLGSIWGEDPRYIRTEGLPLKRRLASVIKMTFLARTRSGDTMPAYSRFVAFPASSFLANEWEPHSQATANEALVRVGLGFLSRMGENAYKEFIAPHK